MSIIATIASFRSTDFNVANTTDPTTTGLNEAEFIAFLTGRGITRADALALFNAIKGDNSEVSQAEFDQLLRLYQAANQAGSGLGNATLGSIVAQVALQEAQILERLGTTTGLTLADTMTLSAKLNMSNAAMTQYMKIFGTVSEQLNNAAAPRG